MRTLSTRSGARLLLLAGLCLAVALGQLATLDTARAAAKGKGVETAAPGKGGGSAPATCPPLGGAVFTTNPAGTVVNGNIYATAGDVFLGGGPAIARHASHGLITATEGPEDAAPTGGRMPAGLPDGRYYFQVTDPGGKKLLSIPAGVQNRQFEVVGGYIQAVLGTHLAITLEDPFPPAYTIVQLSPFKPTPNPGGEYKVWVTPIDAYAPGRGVFGFLPECSKTDNYKVRRGGGGGGSGGGSLSLLLAGSTFLDVDLDGTWEPLANPLEPAQPNVQINVYAAGNPTPVAFTSTSTLGQYSFQLTPTALPATYTVAPVILSGNLAFAPTTKPVQTITVTTSGQVIENLDFGLIRIGDSGSNIRFSPAFFLGGVGSQGQLVLADLAESGDPWMSELAAIAAAPILGAGCVSAPVDASASELSRVLAGNYTAPPAVPANPTCQLTAYWLSLSLAVASDGLPTAYASGGEVSSVTGAEQVYVGLDPLTGLPVYMTLGALLDHVATNYALLSPEYLAFYLGGLQQAADNFTFVQATAGGGGGGGGGDL